ncbi:hypothetical protein SARC_02437 [Sphaeroforma arctica JP610]|uniref:PDZ domain-containing protein n=1 Tax=Sphaeroforma arctica JP610 TaxID=667725 RepID=A0A0L0G8Z2_9EUKA|nr:hypothetical protein SARC_02437 [Sphaeroforma arctica JP610]KNC85379.1 hypothetical protein SARC_02437 [Sphaeroforma arctica JP610]|eukprot:XP_014159281.1 hypothetical protein SARC_02437 [Sphaeroforma arctica JP610]
MADNDGSPSHERTLHEEKKQIEEEFFEEQAARSVAGQQRRRVTVQTRAGESFGVSICRFGVSFYITEVLTGTKAYAAGLSVGDRIDCVNEETVQGSDNYNSVDILEMCKNFDEIRLMVAEKPITRLWRVYQDPTVTRAVRMDDDLGRPVVHLAATDAMNEMQPGLTIFEVNGRDVLHLHDKDVINSMVKALEKQLRVDVSFVPTVFANEVVKAREARRERYRQQGGVSHATGQVSLAVGLRTGTPTAHGPQTTYSSNVAPAVRAPPVQTPPANNSQSNAY